MDTSDATLTARLQSKGIRLTRQRRVLLEVLDNGPHHLNAQELLHHARQRDPSIDRATVYRTLALLKREGLVDELDLLHLEGEQHYYERRTGDDHVHIGCSRCGRIVELDSRLVPELATEVLKRTGFMVSATRIEVRAVCPECQTRR